MEFSYQRGDVQIVISSIEQLRDFEKESTETVAESENDDEGYCG